MITDRLLYFQPMNNLAAHPVEKIAFDAIVRFIKRCVTFIH